MTLLVDANVLIDLGFVQGLDLLPKLDESEVLDIVLLECEEPVGLAEQVTVAGIKEIESQIGWVANARAFKTSRLSSQDALNFYYARTFNRILLTNDKPLRNLCEREGVAFHGLFWTIEQAYQLKLESSEHLCSWLDQLERIGSRFPQKELTNLRQTLQC